MKRVVLATLCTALLLPAIVSAQMSDRRAPGAGHGDRPSGSGPGGSYRPHPETRPTYPTRPVVQPPAPRPPHHRPDHRPPHHARPPYHAYYYPHGYSYRRWSPGLVLPAIFLTSSYIIVNYGTYGGYPPPSKYHWVRYGPDLLLVHRKSGRIRDIRYGVFR